MEEKKTFGQKVKCHLKKHKGKYIAGGIGVGIGVVGYSIGVKIKKRKLDEVVEDAMSVANNSKITNLGLISYKPLVNNTINNYTTINNKLGHPGNKIMCNETKELFNSQMEAATTMGLNTSVLSEHMNGKKATANGYTFKRMVPEESQK